MRDTFTRAEVLRRLQETVESGHPILCATAGSGLIARLLEEAGVDLILTSVTGVARQRGLPSIGWDMGNNNEVVCRIFDEIAAVTHGTPIIASVGAAEPPLGTDLGEVAQEYVDRGYSGILNYPTAGQVNVERILRQRAEHVARASRPGASDYERRLAEASEALQRDCEEKERSGRGFSRELEFVRAAHARDVFTMAFAWTPEQGAAMAAAGADLVVGHCGGTSGGAAGDALSSHEEAAKVLSDIFDGAREVRHDVLLMGHGGPFAAPEDARRMFELTGAVGFLAGSAIERIPIEVAVVAAVKEFKGLASLPVTSFKRRPQDARS